MAAVGRISLKVGAVEGEGGRGVSGWRVSETCALYGGDLPVRTDGEGRIQRSGDTLRGE